MLFQVILTIILFFTIKFIAYRATNKVIPTFIAYQPYSCYKCLGFWMNIFTFITLFILSNCTYWYTLIVGITITVLDAIALHIDENNTTSINDIK